MADVLSILAVLGLVYAGQNMNNKEEEGLVPSEPGPGPEVSREGLVPSEPGSRVMNSLNGEMYTGRILSEDVGNPFSDIAPDRYPGGLPYYLNETSEPYTSGIMNNVAPVEKNLVGPGLGVGPDVPAYGGYQQLFRVKPNNVGGYKLTTLPGRSGPAGDVTGGRHGLIGELNHKIPAKTAYLPSRRPEVLGRAQGQGGAVTGMTNYGKYEKTMRTTNRSETTTRYDGLSYGGANKVVSHSTLAQNPTRNKGDFNAFATNHMNNPSPGINNFYGGYTNTPIAKVTTSKVLSAQELQQAGLRPSENRGKYDRQGNAGRMNVRGNPVNQNGMVSAVRTDTSRVDGWTGPSDGERSQQYVKAMYQDFNSYKGMTNPHTCGNSLSLAQRQLASNDLVPKSMFQ